MALLGCPPFDAGLPGSAVGAVGVGEGVGVAEAGGIEGAGSSGCIVVGISALINNGSFLDPSNSPAPSSDVVTDSPCGCSGAASWAVTVYSVMSSRNTLL